MWCETFAKAKKQAAISGGPVYIVEEPPEFSGRYVITSEHVSNALLVIYTEPGTIPLSRHAFFLDLDAEREPFMELAMDRVGDAPETWSGTVNEKPFTLFLDDPPKWEGNLDESEVQYLVNQLAERTRL